MSDKVRYQLIEIEGSDEPGDETDPDYSVHPGTLEIYGDWKILLDTWEDTDE